MLPAEATSHLWRNMGLKGEGGWHATLISMQTNWTILCHNGVNFEEHNCATVNFSQINILLLHTLDLHF